MKRVLRDSSGINAHRPLGGASVYVSKTTEHNLDRQLQIRMRKYLISANESGAESSKNVDYSGTAVAPDRIIRSDLGHVRSPANVLPHYNSEVRYKERVLLSLAEKGGKKSSCSNYISTFQS